MRLDVLQIAAKTTPRGALTVLTVCLAVSFSGCQLTQAPSGSKPSGIMNLKPPVAEQGDSAQSQAAEKPSGGLSTAATRVERKDSAVGTASSPKTQPIPEASYAPISATIRGQSPLPGTPSSPASAAPTGNRYAYPYGDPLSLSPLGQPPSGTSPTQIAAQPVPSTGLGGVAPAARTAAGNFLPQSGNLPAPQPATPPQAYGFGGQNSYSTPPQAQSPAIATPGSQPYGTPAYGGQPLGGPISGAPGDYGSTLAPGVSQFPYSDESAVAPGAFPSSQDVDPLTGIGAPDINRYRPQERIAPIDVYVQEARTGRIILGGAVNSDLGVSGQLIIDERNFDIWRYPRSWDEVWSGRSFRGGGQNFRAEIMPGSQVQRYTLNWTEPHFRDLPYSLSVGGFMYTRQFRDWTEQRLGGRVALGYEITKDLSVSTEMRLEDVKLFSPRISGVPELDDALGSNDVYRGRFRLAHDTRDNPFMSSQGGLVELIYDQVFGEYDYSRGQINLNRYFLMRERADGGGRHTLASTWKIGVTGAQTPIFENFFAGGYSTMRGFSFRGASPKVGDVQVGGEFMFLGSLEYVFPLTADEMLRAVAFVDYGTVEQDLELHSENFRIAPGMGLRIAVPALGPAPLAFDFAFPINYADTDDRQVFSFFMGLTRS